MSPLSVSPCITGLFLLSLKVGVARSVASASGTFLPVGLLLPTGRPFPPTSGPITSCQWNFLYGCQSPKFLLLPESLSLPLGGPFISLTKRFRFCRKISRCYATYVRQIESPFGFQHRPKVKVKSRSRSKIKIETHSQGQGQKSKSRRIVKVKVKNQNRDAESKSRSKIKIKIHG
ncbi:hypothetical protein PHYBLDRAFT_170546 [Phycomyces blakesleeanus NRRL 1555(-)]|uniref:Uncharacterized protein n=1 Tax=Phycomyces blakesleeanus (strain ATCC 8743b / DSM 1359 / FGSC 10004 / NBRC 33097 / NRRL 1555) TaxID=763407 RepID=A0A167LVC0_PHYB8|nr:hypothetical protein PHYBLDRAFT_170546 [Phycomyces blakesleeanus NRRL 1555(-)]OAD71167.1 hypothetical protein PHYBLDRAFT_170546 [Phycomyces blakesleeanus NRRL 1555(-)]|eukprot:XP_018289207.1 hypothetical protein PHYBLDRAFT_170546 [Phycomyces blakesleeanus NRRL 1555(-)]